MELEQYNTPLQLYPLNTSFVYTQCLSTLSLPPPTTIHLPHSFNDKEVTASVISAVQQRLLQSPSSDYAVVAYVVLRSPFILRL